MVRYWNKRRHDQASQGSAEASPHRVNEAGAGDRAAKVLAEALRRGGREVSREVVAAREGDLRRAFQGFTPGHPSRKALEEMLGDNLAVDFNVLMGSARTATDQQLRYDAGRAGRTWELLRVLEALWDGAEREEGIKTGEGED